MINTIIDIIGLYASQWTLGMGASETYDICETPVTFRKRGRWEGMQLSEEWIEVTGASLSPKDRAYISEKTGWAIKGGLYEQLPVNSVMESILSC